MLRSSTRKFIFIHIPKTAGSSVKDSLIPYADSGLWKYLATPFRKLCFPINLGPEPLEAHATAQDILELLGNEFYDYYRFAFVRHPYNYIASTYLFIKSFARHSRHAFVSNYSSLDEFVDHEILRGYHKPQSEYIYSHDNKLLVNFVGRFETLAVDHQCICNYLNIPVTLPYLNKSISASSELPLSTKSKDILHSYYEVDFLNFSYQPY